MTPDRTAPVPSGQASRLNPANALTLLRLLLIPAFIALFFAGGGHAPSLRLAAAGVFVLAAVTDRVDGELARRWSLVTDVGKVADPIADKALTGAALVGLSLLGTLPWWVAVTIFTRELGVTLLRLLIRRRSVIPTSYGGKVKTAVQFMAIVAYLFPPAATPYGELLVMARGWVMAVAVVITLATGLDYLGRALRLARSSPAGETGGGSGQ